MEKGDISLTPLHNDILSYRYFVSPVPFAIIVSDIICP
jgi:hypothetical protein